MYNIVEKVIHSIYPLGTLNRDGFSQLRNVSVQCLAIIDKYQYILGVLGIKPISKLI